MNLKSQPIKNKPNWAYKENTNFSRVLNKNVTNKTYFIQIVGYQARVEYQKSFKETNIYKKDWTVYIFNYDGGFPTCWPYTTDYFDSAEKGMKWAESEILRGLTNDVDRIEKDLNARKEALKMLKG